MEVLLFLLVILAILAAPIAWLIYASSETVRLRKEKKKMLALHTEVQTLLKNSPLTTPEAFARGVARFIDSPYHTTAFSIVSRLVRPYLELPQPKWEGEAWIHFDKQMAWAKEFIKTHEGYQVLFIELFRALFRDLPKGGPAEEEAFLTFPSSNTITLDPLTTVEAIQQALLNEKPFSHPLWENIKSATSYFSYGKKRKEYFTPREALKKVEAPEHLFAFYLKDTPWMELLNLSVPVSIPFKLRFETTHILATPGTGKTQLLQHFLKRDLEHGYGVVVIDSQGSMIRNILQLDLMRSRDLILIDPRDIDYPVAINLFDVSFEGCDPVQKEQLLNQSISLYETFFGSLLGAELTSRQRTVFKYLARLMLEIPHATVATVIDVMLDSDDYIPYMERLDPVSQRFFFTMFRDKGFDATKMQIAQRIYDVLSSGTFRKMFSHTQNKFDLYDALNSGKVVLINTAKGFLQEEYCSIFGRFFLALLMQSIMKRDILPEEARTPAFVYVDECQDYMDESFAVLIAQARKYRVGFLFANQFTTQFASRDITSAFLGASLKFAASLNEYDARLYSSVFDCDADLLKNTPRFPNKGHFLVKAVNQPFARYEFPFGELEGLPKLTQEDYDWMIQQNRERYSEEPNVDVPVPEKIHEPEAEEGTFADPDDDTDGQGREGAFESAESSESPKKQNHKHTVAKPRKDGGKPAQPRHIDDDDFWQ